jgi:redox-regulated HSP33 family molecular chaperone
MITRVVRDGAAQSQLESLRAVVHLLEGAVDAHNDTLVGTGLVEVLCNVLGNRLALEAATLGLRALKMLVDWSVSQPGDSIVVLKVVACNGAGSVRAWVGNTDVDVSKMAKAVMAGIAD